MFARIYCILEVPRWGGSCVIYNILEVRRWGGNGVCAYLQHPRGTAMLRQEAVAAVVYEARSRGTAAGMLLPGQTPEALLGVDALEVWLAAVDPAGNESPRVRVPNVEWVATMGREVAGDDGVNPHLLEARAQIGRASCRERV